MPLGLPWPLNHTKMPQGFKFSLAGTHALPKPSLNVLLRPLPQARAGRRLLLWFSLNTMRMSHLLEVLLVAHDFASPDQGLSYSPFPDPNERARRQKHW